MGFVNDILKIVLKKIYNCLLRRIDLVQMCTTGKKNISVFEELKGVGENHVRERDKKERKGKHAFKNS